MDFSWLKPLVGKAQRSLVKNAPHILMALGTTGSITAVIFAIKATPAAERAITDAEIDDAEKRIQDGECQNGETYVALRKLPWQKTLKLCWKHYIPAAGMELFSLLCFWGAHGIDVKRQAIIAGLYSTAQEALSVYQQKVTDMIGEKAEKEIRNSIAEDQIANLPPPQTNVFMADDTDVWCLIDGQYFRSSYIKIKDAQNDANREMIQNMYISKSDLYWMLDPEHKYLKTTSTDDQVGWCVDKKLVLDTDFGSDQNHRPILVIRIKDEDGFDYMPSPGFCNML